jgi:hypothetical protein
MQLFILSAMYRELKPGASRIFLPLPEKQKVAAHHHNDDEVLPEVEEQFEKLFEEMVHNSAKVGIRR